VFVTVEQCKQIIKAYLGNSGRGGFMTGIVSSVSPLIIQSGQRLEIGDGNTYVTDNCIGLKVNGMELRPPLKVGDGVLILCRPDNAGGVKYIVLDRIQPFTPMREVTL
jgi:hypothetical protein